MLLLFLSLSQLVVLNSLEDDDPLLILPANARPIEVSPLVTKLEPGFGEGVNDDFSLVHVEREA